MSLFGILAILSFIALKYWMPFPNFVTSFLIIFHLWMHVPCMIGYFLCTLPRKTELHPWTARLHARFNPIWTTILACSLAIIWPVMMLGFMGVLDADVPLKMDPEDFGKHKM